jgi:predicted type IV restriction endonuclease
MNEELFHFVETLKKRKGSERLDYSDEAATKQGIVLRILSLLGWNAFNIDEVKPEHAVAEGRVDYSLRIERKDRLFIEVKKAGEELDGHEEQLLAYSFKAGIRIAVLTNGFKWWFYLPLNEGSWEQRKFYMIDISQQESQDVVSKFIDFLSRDNVTNEKVITNAEEVYKSRKKESILKETFLKAWDRLISEPDDRLIELMTNKTEELCGYKPDAELVEQFLVKRVTQRAESTPQLVKSSFTPTRRDISTQTASVSGGYTNKSVSAFIFNEKQYRPKSWKELLMAMCDVFKESQGSEFEKVLNLVGRKRPYFTRNPNELRIPQKISGTNIFVETNLNANQITKICSDMLSVFGYPEDALKIETV